MDERDELAVEFETHRSHLRAVAYRMLGSSADVDDAVQETWLRLARVDIDEVQNLQGWLTTTLARICLDTLRKRTSRREVSLDVHLPDPVVEPALDPEQDAVLTDSVSLALLVVLDALTPAERLAFVLHDVFAVPFTEIGALMHRSPAGAKQLASRARRRVQSAPVPDPDLRRQRTVVDAFIAAARDGDFDALLAVLHPDVVLRADAGDGPFGPSRVLRGAPAVAAEAARFSAMARFARPALVNGAVGAVAMPGGRAAAVLSATVTAGRIAEINILADPRRLAQLDFSALTPTDPQR
jgi:RNA polymerase sigma-70 factor (ECF subfamily)